MSDFKYLIESIQGKELQEVDMDILDKIAFEIFTRQTEEAIKDKAWDINFNVES